MDSTTGHGELQTSRFTFKLLLTHDLWHLRLIASHISLGSSELHMDPWSEKVPLLYIENALHNVRNSGCDALCRWSRKEEAHVEKDTLRFCSCESCPPSGP
eukprot:407971-Amphidinium_carterae.1